MLADQVALVEPGLQFCVEIVERTQLEMVDVVARADGVDAREPRIFQAPSQDDVANEAIAAKADCREAHPDLKGDPRFFRENEHPSAPLYPFHKFAINGQCLRAAALQVFAQRVPRTGV